MLPAETQKTLEEMATGSMRAFERLYDVWHVPGIRSLIKKGCRKELALEVCNDLWMIFFQKRFVLHSTIKNFEAYYYWALRNKWLDAMKKERRGGIEEVEIEKIPEGTETFELFELEENEYYNKDQLEKWLTKLGEKYPKCVEIISLYYLEGYVHREITTIMEYENANTGRTSLNRCMGRLKAIAAAA